MFFFNTLIDFVLLIYNYIDKEINDETKLQQQLLEVRLKYEMDDITEEEYKKNEEILVQRINEIREIKMADDEEEDEI